jgi:hypothetical protein
VVAGQHLEEHRKALGIDSAISADVIVGIYMTKETEKYEDIAGERMKDKRKMESKMVS